MGCLGWGGAAPSSWIESPHCGLHCGPRLCPHPTLRRHNRGLCASPKEMFIPGPGERQGGGREVSALVEEEWVIKV